MTIAPVAEVQVKGLDESMIAATRTKLGSEQELPSPQLTLRPRHFRLSYTY